MRRTIRLVPVARWARGVMIALAWATELLAPSVVRAQQKMEMRRSAAPDISLRIQGSFATLRVIGSSRDSVILKGSLPRGFRMEGGFGGAVDSPARGGKIFVEGPDPMGPSAGTLEVRLPANATLWVKAFNATIDVSGVTGGLDLNVVGGSVRVSGSPRELSIASMDGAITVNGSPTWTRLKTADGDIVMTGGSTDAAFTTVSGAIRVSDGALERARFETVSGGIEFGGDIARGGVFTVDTHSGAVDFRLSPKASVEIDAASITGMIENQIGRIRPEPGRDGRGATLTTSLGQGGARLVIRTFKGNIRLSSR